MAMDMTAQLIPMIWMMVGVMVVSGLSLFAAHDNK